MANRLYPSGRDLGQVLSQLMSQQQITQAEMARRIGGSEGGISRLVNRGSGLNPAARKINQVLRVMGKDWRDLVAVLAHVHGFATTDRTMELQRQLAQRDQDMARMTDLFAEIMRAHGLDADDAIERIAKSLQERD